MAWPWDSAAGGGFRCEVADNKARLVDPCLVSSRSFLRRLGLANMDLSRQLREQAIQGAGYVTGAGDLCLYMCISCAILRECPSAHRNFLAFDSLRYHGYTSARSPPRPAPPDPVSLRKPALWLKTISGIIFAILSWLCFRCHAACWSCTHPQPPCHFTRTRPAETGIKSKIDTLVVAVIEGLHLCHYIGNVVLVLRVALGHAHLALTESR